MLTRRDLFVAGVSVAATLVTAAWAASPAKPAMPSSNFNWNSLKVVPTATGEKRDVFRQRTATLDQLEMHVTTVKPGERAHAPHKHWEEELIIVKEGTLESLQNGETTRVGPGSIVFQASNDLHGLKNVGDTPATYYVIKWFPPGSMADATK